MKNNQFSSGTGPRFEGGSNGKTRPMEGQRFIRYSVSRISLHVGDFSRLIRCRQRIDTGVPWN